MPALPAAASPWAVGTGAETPDGSDEKPPKQLPTGVWDAAIQRFNAVEIQGIPRSFPERELLGAEATLARTRQEHTKSKLYTPVGLTVAFISFFHR